MVPMSKDQGKVVLASFALVRFTAINDQGEPDYTPWTLKELFSPMSERMTETQVMVKAGTSKRWQRGLMERLIKYEIIEKTQINQGHGVAYRSTPIGRGLMIHILEECTELKEQSLRWLVFPQNYQPTGEFEALLFPDEGEGSTEMDEEEENGAESVLTQLLQVTSSLQENTIELRKEMKELRQKNIELGEGLTMVAEALQKHHKAVAEGVASMMHSSEVIQKDIEELTTQLGVRDRLEQLKGRLHVWSTHNEGLLKGIRSCAAQENEIKAAIDLLMEKASVHEEETGPTSGRVPSDG